MARTQQRMRIEQLEERALEELGLDPDGLVADYGPDQLVSRAHRRRSSAEGEEAPDPVPFDREEQTKRLRTAERALAQLGRINPLALEEFSALEERHKFLTEQLEDLKSTRKDLLDIVREVDDRVQQVFTEAYADVSTAFDATFARLFPGGEGRLVLTDPDDMLNTGIEVEARPPGKKVKRLSLLSGGERSLVAVAFLVALFKARPSPFYILDEVEAALDDTNLGRLLEIYEELRENSQLLVITHQKRTMEVGDALYGVTMRGDGVSAVISQRLREPSRPERPIAAATASATGARATTSSGEQATTRWADDDVYGHMNNARYFELIDTAVNDHLAEATGVDIRALPAIGVVAEVGCRYFREIGYPEPVDLGLVVDKVGTSSVVYRVGLFQGDDGEGAGGRRGPVRARLRRQHRRPRRGPAGHPDPRARSGRPSYPLRD